MTIRKFSLESRDVFTVARQPVGWAVEHDGLVTDLCVTKDEARAAAHKLARAAHDAGRACQVTVSDETGYFPASNAMVAR